MEYFRTKKPIYNYLFFFIIALTFNFQGLTGQTISFGSSGLIGESILNPTSLEFGPDGRLYENREFPCRSAGNRKSGRPELPSAPRVNFQQFQTAMKRLHSHPE